MIHFIKELCTERQVIDYFQRHCTQSKLTQASRVFTKSYVISIESTLNNSIGINIKIVL
jgi:hypothetical protein